MPALEPLSKGASTGVGSVAPAGLKRRSIVLMIVLVIVTFGLYYPIWFLRRRDALNRLDSPRQLRRWPFAIPLAFFALQVLVGLVSAPGQPEQTIGEGAALLLNGVQLEVGIFMVVQCFHVKDILEDHLLGPEGTISSSPSVDRVKLSGLMTFFFQIFYLQYVINQHIFGSRQQAV
ncbi:MAG: DUF4234 domain-containing protein [Vicinamibacterales bacterium]|mgnify:CR=1 FL=1